MREACPQCGRRSLVLSSGTHGTSAGCRICGYTRMGSEVIPGRGVVAIFTRGGGMIELREPVADDYDRYDKLLAAGALMVHRSYITEVLDADTDREVVVVARGELP